MIHLLLKAILKIYEFIDLYAAYIFNICHIAKYLKNKHSMHGASMIPFLQSKLEFLKEKPNTSLLLVSCSSMIHYCCFENIAVLTTDVVHRYAVCCGVLMLVSGVLL